MNVLLVSYVNSTRPLFVRTAGLALGRVGWMREGEERQEWDFDAFYHD